MMGIPGDELTEDEKAAGEAALGIFMDAVDRVMDDLRGKGLSVVDSLDVLTTASAAALFNLIARGTNNPLLIRLIAKKLISNYTETINMTASTIINREQHTNDNKTIDPT